MLVLVLLSGRTEAASDTLRNKYLAAWAARLDGYRAEYIRHDTVLRKEIAAGTERIFGSGSVEWSDLVSPVMESSLKIHDNFTIAGRGETIKRFIVHMQTDPTPGLTEVWFQTEVAELQRQAQVVDSNTQLFLASLNDRVEMSNTWILEIEQLARAQGMVVGTIQELPLLFQNAQSYLPRAEADPRRGPAPGGAAAPAHARLAGRARPAQLSAAAVQHPEPPAHVPARRQNGHVLLSGLAPFGARPL